MTDARWPNEPNRGQFPGNGKPHKSTARRIATGALAAIGAAATLLGVFGGVTTLAQGEESYSRASANNFAREYLALAPPAPDLALKTLTTQQFKDLAGGEESSYVSFWQGVDSVDLAAVKTDSSDGKDWFEIDYSIRYKNGKVEPITTRWKLTCADRVRKYAPFFSCPSRDLLLDDAQQAPSH